MANELNYCCISCVKERIKTAIAEVKKEKITAPLPGWNVAIDPLLHKKHNEHINTY